MTNSANTADTVKSPSPGRRYASLLSHVLVAAGILWSLPAMIGLGFEDPDKVIVCVYILASATFFGALLHRARHRALFIIGGATAGAILVNAFILLPIYIAIAVAFTGMMFWYAASMLVPSLDIMNRMVRREANAT